MTRKPRREGSMDWFWLFIVLAAFACFVGLVGLCGRLR